MGHSSVTVTLDHYGHLYEGLDGQIADALDDVLRHSRGLAGLCPLSGPSARPLQGRKCWSEPVGAEGLEPPTPSL